MDNDNNNFLNKFKGQVEYIGKNGIIGIMKSAHFQINKKKDNKNNNQYPDMKLILMEKKKKIKEIKMKRDKTLKTLKLKFNLNTKKQSSKNLKTYNTPKKKLTKIKIISNKKNNRSKERYKKIYKRSKTSSSINLKIKKNKKTYKRSNTTSIKYPMKRNKSLNPISSNKSFSKKKI